MADETTPPEDQAEEKNQELQSSPDEQTPTEAAASADDAAPEAQEAVNVGEDSAGASAPATDALADGDTPGAPEAGDDAPRSDADAAASVLVDADAGAAETAAAGDDARTGEADEDGDSDETPRIKPAIPGADLEVDIVAEGEDPLTRTDAEQAALDEEAAADELDEQPIAAAAIDLAADARYRATGKRKTAKARVILRPGTGAYTINGKTLDQFFPRPTLQRTIRQPLETVGYEDRMDVIATMEGGGVSAQAGALRHGISRALLEADPNLRGELKRRGFLTRDARAKERKKAGLKKARKRPQFSKR